MKRACKQAAVLLQQRAAGLSAAAGLELEEHLHGCVSCRESANLLDGLRSVYAADPAPLSVAQREATIERAFAASLAPTARAGVPHPRFARRTRAAVWVIAPALAALAVLGLVRALREARTGESEHAAGEGRAPRAGQDLESKHGAAPDAIAHSDTPAEHDLESKHGAAPDAIAHSDTPAEHDLEPEPGAVAHSDTPAGHDLGPGRGVGARGGNDRVLAGSVQRGEIEIGVGLPLSASDEFASANGATLALGHATAQLRAASRVRWDARREQLQLISGSVEVAVDPGPKRRFSVTTGRFSAVVLGTVFEVSLERVRVREGRVRVIDRSGRELALLDALKRPLFELGADSAAPSDPAPLLELAREQISQRQLPAARRSLARVLSLTITREQRAEARSLQAECALVAGEYAAARDSYLSVVSEFPDLAAGQTALFAAARIEAQHGQPKRAAELFQRYLDRYPSGRFAHEAAVRLRKTQIDSDAHPGGPKP